MTAPTPPPEGPAPRTDPNGAHPKSGIARRIAYLTREQPWPSVPGEGIMVFTAEPRSPLLGKLSQYGIKEVKTL